MDNVKEKMLDTDVVVIGCEGAGARAAIEAARCGAQVTCLTKGRLGKSGATVAAGNDMFVDSKSIVEIIGMAGGDIRDSKDKFFRDIVVEGKYLCNQKVVEKHVQDVPLRIKELVDWGMKVWGPFQRTVFEGYPRGVYSPTGEMTRVLVSRLKSLGEKVRVIENVVVKDLLTCNGAVAGAVGVNVVSGELIVVRAKAVILATGGGMRIYPHTSASEELTGDGVAMAYRAGAEITDIEFVQFLMHTFKYPPVSTLSVNPLLVVGVWLLNNRGDRFMRYWDPEKLEYTTRDLVMVAATNEIVEGRGWEDERGEWVYMSLKHLPDNIIDDYAFRNVYSKMWTQKDKNFWENAKKRAIPIFPASHYFPGGIRINENCETNVWGLYAAGEVTAGLDGAHRVMGNGTTATQVQGAMAGRMAAQYALKIERPDEDTGQLDKLRNDIFQPLEREKGISAITIKRRIQSSVYRNVGVVKNGTWLEEGLKEITEIKNDLSQICVKTKTRVYNREWVDALQVGNMLQVVEMIARAALLRTESRGLHYRKDYPHTDNDHWAKNMVIKRVKGKMQVTDEPVVVTRFDPPAGIYPYPLR